MKFILIEPPRTPIKKGNMWKTVNRSLPSLGLAYIAAYLEKHEIVCKILDLNVNNISVEDLIKEIRLFNPSYIGFTATTPQINPALFLAEQIKNNVSKVKIIFGGPHPNIFSDDQLKNNYVDMVVRGEGEYTLCEIAQGKKFNEISGLSYKRNGNIVHNPPRPSIQKLDSLPYPARHLLPMDKYMPSKGSYLRLPAASIITSRGCPGKCTFCHTGIHGQKIRYRSAENIAGEIKEIVREYGIKEVSFYDDTFTAHKKNVQELCNILIHDNVNITWSCMSRVDHADLDTLRAMKEAGCHQIGYGIESGDETVLSNLNKKTSLEKSKKAVRLAKKAGIDVRAMFMLGNPGETSEGIEKTLNFAISLDPDIYVFNITTPLPGTAMFEWADKKGYLITKDWDQYDLGQVLMNLPTIENEEVLKYYKQSYKRCYFRLSYLLKRLPKLNSIASIKMHLQVFMSMMSNFLPFRNVS